MGWGWIAAHWIAATSALSTLGGAAWRLRRTHPVARLAAILAANIDLRIALVNLAIRDRRIAALETENAALRSQLGSGGGTASSSGSPAAIPERSSPS